MALLTNTSVGLEYDAPKKDAVVSQVATTTTATGVSLWASALGVSDNVEQIVGDFWKLYRYAKSNMPAVKAAIGIAPPVVVVSMPLGGADSDIGIGVLPSAGDVVMDIGEDIASAQASHFLDRTFKRCLERFLEEAK